MVIYLKPNNEFIKNLSEDQINKLIHLKEPIPNRLENMLTENIPDFRNNRSFNMSAKSTRLQQAERGDTLNMSIEESSDYTANLAFEFLKKHPEFKPMIEEVVEI
ncbi:hypothetical protein [Methanobrevibacter sp. DSM 116169]|uniref:hypothetical protein n=1 Tax=Methanobrevibacter sp. DSM 116169 TaxID=3242727 RepID=UPI0038FC097F